MLVLSRKVNEKIQIGNDILLTVTFIGEDKVRIGIDAPQTVRILRSEIATPKRDEMGEVIDRCQEEQS